MPLPAGRNRDRLGTGRDRAMRVGRNCQTWTECRTKFEIGTVSRTEIGQSIGRYRFADPDSVDHYLKPVVVTTYFDPHYWLLHLFASGQHPAVELQQSVYDRHR